MGTLVFSLPDDLSTDVAVLLALEGGDPPAAPPFARLQPVSDVSAGGWAPSTGADLYAVLAGISANDSTYAESPSAPGGATMAVALQDAIKPQRDDYHTLYVRWKKSAPGGAQIDATVEVYQGITLIATRSYEDIGGADFASVEIALTEGEAASIVYTPAGALTAPLEPRITATQQGALLIPQVGDWTQQGVAVAKSSGQWDNTLAGASVPSSLVKKGGTYYLYYGGSDGARSSDGGPRHRAIGVATSSDGITFTKHAGNPVMTHLPTNGEEEGATSAGVTLDSSGNFVMYYGANTDIGGDEVVADGRLATSTDGLAFTDQAKVIDHTNTNVWGYGDELFPLAAYHYGGNWYVFYVTNGGTAPRDVGVAWGSSMSALSSTAQVVDGDNTNPAHIGANITWLAPDLIGVWVQRNWWPNIYVELRTAHPSTPHILSAPVVTYNTTLWKEDTKFFTIFLDTDNNRWLLYRTSWDDEIIVYTAPATQA